MKTKIKLILAGFFGGVAAAARPYDLVTFMLCGVAALIGVDAWFSTRFDEKKFIRDAAVGACDKWERQRAAELQKPLP